MDIDIIKDELEFRGLRLNLPSNDNSISCLKMKYPDINNIYINMYKRFDGMSPGIYDDDTGVHILSISEILTFDLEDVFFKTYLPFADEFMASDFYMVNSIDPLAPVIKFNDKKVVFNNFENFIIAFLNGELSVSLL